MKRQQVIFVFFIYIWQLENDKKRVTVNFTRERKSSKKLLNEAIDLTVRNQELEKQVKEKDDTITELEYTIKQLSKNIEDLSVEKVTALEKEKVEMLKKITTLEKEKTDGKSKYTSVVGRLEKDILSKDFEIREARRQRIVSMASATSRGKILKEFYFTEKSYIVSLFTLRNEYITPITQKRLISKKNLKYLFAEIDDIIKVNRGFLVDLEQQIFCRSSDVALVRLVLKFSSDFKASYSSYIKKCSLVKEKLTELVRKSKRLQTFLKLTAEKLKKDKSRSLTIGYNFFLFFFNDIFYKFFKTL